MPCQIRPGLRRLWRDVGRLQIGVDPSRALVLDGLTAQDEVLLEDLDGRFDREVVLERAGARGADLARSAGLLALLADAGVLEPELRRAGSVLPGELAADAAALSLLHACGDGWDVLARRVRQCVLVVGAGRTGLATSTGLLEAGVGSVLLEDTADDAVVRRRDLATGGHRAVDVGRRRGRSSADVLRRWEDARGSRPVVPGDREQPAQARPAARSVDRADLVVLVDHAASTPARRDGLLREDVPHLAVVLGEDRAVVGPLVLPGRTACLRCLDLHRTDRDPEWPRLHPQLLVSSGGPADEPVVLARLAAALAVAQVLAHLDGLPEDGDAEGLAVGAGDLDRGLPASAGTSWELVLPDGLPVSREWSPHPRCGCTWPPPP